jgi:hypothetical protein
MTTPPESGEDAVGLLGGPALGFASPGSSMASAPVKRVLHASKASSPRSTVL